METSRHLPRISLLRRLADLGYRRRWSVLGAWVLLLVALELAGAAAGEFDNNFDLPGSESQEAFDLMEGSSGFADRAGTTIQVVVSAPEGVGDAAVRDGFEALLSDIRDDVRGVEVLSPYAPSGERQIAGGAAAGTIAYAELNLADRTDEEFSEAGDQLKEAVAAFDVPGAVVELGGDPVIVGPEQEFGSEAFGLLAAVVILLIAFGSVLAMGLPLVTALFGIACGSAIVQLVANVVTMPTFTLQLVLMLGIGVGIDYALFIVTRYRQALNEGLDPESAVVQAIDTATDGDAVGARR